MYFLRDSSFPMRAKRNRAGNTFFFAKNTKMPQFSAKIEQEKNELRTKNMLPYKRYFARGGTVFSGTPQKDEGCGARREHGEPG